MTSLQIEILILQLRHKLYFLIFGLIFAIHPVCDAQVQKVTSLLSSQTPKACTCTLSQGNFSTSIDFVTGSQNPVAFYNYIGSSATTGLEMSNTALFFLYEGGNSSALITILDIVNDGSGGGANIEYTCLPSSAFVALADDGGELNGGPPNITGNFSWSPCCTDGGVIEGVGCGDSFIINPSFSSGINSIAFVSGTQSAPIYLTLPDMSCPIIINCGGTTCCDEAFEFNATVQNASCSYSTNGSIQLNTTCAATPTFSWSNGETTKNITGLTPGSYTVTITDAGGCTAEGTYTVGTTSQVPDPSVTGATIFCEGESVNLGVNGSFNSYSWSNGDFGPTITVSQPGDYTVTVSNTAGCTGTATTTLLMNPAPEVQISGNLELCNNETVTLDAGPGFLQYIWSNNVYSQTSTIAAPGTYTVTVFNNNGCIGTDEVIVVAKPSPQPIINGPTSLCSGTLVTLDAGDNFLTYNWSNSLSGQSVSVNSGGLYTVTVTNEAGCSGTDEHVVVLNTSDTLRIRQTSCNPADTGVFYIPYVNSSGCPSLKIQTIDYAQSDSIVKISSSCMPQDTGVFVRRFKNRFGCDSIDIRIVEFSLSDFTTFESRSCNPKDTGRVQQVFKNLFGCDSIVVKITRLLTSDSITRYEKSCNPLNVGTKSFKYINRYGCDSLVTIQTSFALSDTTILQKFSCDATQSGTSESYFFNSEGCDSVVIQQTFWQKPDTTIINRQTCLPSDTGKITLALQNTFGCDSFVITSTTLLAPVQCLLNIEVKADTIPCTSSTGAIRLAIPGGTPPFNYSWRSADGQSGSTTISQGLNTTVITALPPGLYTITVSDSQGLTAESSVSLFTPAPLKISTQTTTSYSGFGVSCPGASDGKVQVKVDGGGVPPYQYRWSNGSNGTDIQNLSAGWYKVTATSAFGCSQEDSVFISAPPPLSFDAVVTPPDCNTGGLGAISLMKLAGGAGGYSVAINGGQTQSRFFFDKLSAGPYKLTVFDANGCTADLTKNIPTYIFPDVQLQNDTIIQKGAGITLQATTNLSLSAIDTLYWEGIDCASPCFFITVNPETTTSFTVILEDSLGCRSQEQVTVTVIQNEEIIIPNIFSPDGNGTNDRFTIFGGEGLQRIQSLVVYDRWGNVVYLASDIPPNDPSLGWDGSFGTGRATRGVYVYKCILTIARGVTRILNGNITLIR